MHKKDRVALSRNKSRAVPDSYSAGAKLLPEAEIRRLYHELEVHQIELRMQNDELQIAKEKAESLSAKFSALYDFSPSGYFTLDRQGIILELNLNAAKLLNNERLWLTGHNFSLFIHPSDRIIFEKFISNIFISGIKQNCEIRMPEHHENEYYIYLEGIASEKEKCIVSAIDISKHRKTENALRESESRLQDLNATKDKFFSIIAHDLRGPFSSILGFSDLIVESVENKNFNDLHQYALIIQTASSQAMDLLSNLLVWSRLQTGKLQLNAEKIEIRKMVEQVIIIMNFSIQRKSIKISHNLSDEIHVVADKEMLSNVFRNLISNAIKFTRLNGEITIHVAIITRSLVVMVQDNGVGIEPDQLNKLFRIDSGYSTRGTHGEEGTGLGLLLCKEFISNHKGRIWAESEPGTGSKFYFTIPMNQ